MPELSPEREREIAEAVIRSVLNTWTLQCCFSRGEFRQSLSGSLNELASSSGVPMEEMAEFLKPHLNQMAMDILVREQQQEMENAMTGKHPLVAGP